MSWTQVLNDVTSRISAAQQSLQTFDPSHQTYSSSTTANNGAHGPVRRDSQFQSMSVRVQLDQQDAPYYTNLDFVAGRVILNLATDTTISAINVKLEGESRTRLSGPKFQNDPKNRQKIELELHKLLYKVQTVFPSPNMTQDGMNAQYTLAAGQYSYPFSLKIPFNNDCINNNVFQDLKLGPLLGPDFTAIKHTKQTLPPGLAGFPGEAEIKYFVKATVVRPKFYQENIRSVVDIKFQPIEPPRPAKRHEETYARRLHQFQTMGTLPKPSKSSLFRKSAPPVEDVPPAIKVEARLPSPTIVSCHQPLPLRILVDKTNDSSATIILSLLQIELIGFTTVRAHDLKRTETGSWILMSQANINLPLDISADSSSKSFQIPSRFWENIPLPNTVAPSFTTCNIQRSYELEVRVGISHSTADGVKPELIVLPLRLPLQVYSGIAPPEKLLNRISTHISTSSKLTPPQSANNQQQPSPVTPAQDQLPAQQGQYAPPLTDDPDDLPPSYEDAMAEDIAPVDGPRRNIVPSEPPNTTRQVSDIKNSSGLNRHPSERLFSQNAPSPPTVRGESGMQQSTVDPPAASGEVSNLISVLNVKDLESSDEPVPPPLPARKPTADSTNDKKGPLGTS